MNHEFPFDPTGGYSAETLIAGPVTPLPPEPVDYAEFWTAQYQRAMAAALDWRLRPASVVPPTGWSVQEISFAGMAGAHRVGGWLVRPVGRPVRRGLVWTHGYGGRGEPEFDLPVDDAAVIFPVCTGLPTMSLHPDIGALTDEHVIAGLSSRETYVHLFCVMDVWRAASVLIEAVPEAAARLDYIGGSFGGGIGALALPWESRFTSGHLRVPSFGNHPLRLSLGCSGSGASVQRYVQTHPEARDVLAYFDAAVAATRIQIPVQVAAAVFDPAVPPAGQFAVHHALSGPKPLVVMSAGHFDHADSAAENAKLSAELRHFFAD